MAILLFSRQSVGTLNLLENFMKKFRLLNKVMLGIGLAFAISTSYAASPAASSCPPTGFLSGNLAPNPGFEISNPNVLPNEQQAWWQNGDSLPAPSAAKGWFMASSNVGARVCSQLVPSTAPGPHGNWMLRYTAGGNEGGVFQRLALNPLKSYMLSAWVFVVRGKVVVQPGFSTALPTSWSTKHGEWEQLRVCTNSLVSSEGMVIVNEDLKGGLFYVDRVELREIPALE